MITKKLLFSCLLFIGSTILLFAQEITVSGKVTEDLTSTGIPGVNVSIKGTTRGVTTDTDGNYSISVPDQNTVLVFSFVGYVTQEVTVGNQTKINIILATDVKTLSDVVVIGYGQAKKAEISTAISSINVKEIKDLPVPGVDQALQGRLAGVEVSSNGGQPGGGISVKVRGITSVNGNSPLYVIDGVITGGETSSPNQNFLGGGNGSTTQSILANLNTNDIVSIDVLKDAAAQAIYGSRAANGVVIITTKKGVAGEGKLTYDMYYGVQQLPKKLSIMDLRQFAEYSNSITSEINAVTGGNQQIIPEFANPSLLGSGTNWQDAVYQKGSIQSHNITFSGGQGKTNYYFSGGYLDQQGTLIETFFKRYTFRTSIDQQVKSWLKAGFSANLSKSDQKIGLSDGFDAVTSVVLYNSPASPIRDVNGNYIAQTNIGGTNFGNPRNPVALARNRDVRNFITRGFGALYTEVEFIKGLSLRNEFNYDFNLTSGKAYQPYIKNDSTNVIILSPSQLQENRTNSFFWALKNYLNYNKSFGKHAVSATLGHESQKSKYDYIGASRYNLQNNLPSLAAGDITNQAIQADANVWTLESFFARIGYIYADKYGITATYRADGSSNFGANNRWGYFPAASLYWTVSNESFMKDIDNFSYLKVRLGAGAVGNQNTNGSNLYTSNVSLVNTPFGQGSQKRNIANPNLQWESVITYNAGIDATIFKDVDITVDVYKKETTKMLLSLVLGDFSGLGTNYNDLQTPTVNGGRMTNTGIDVSINSTNLRANGLVWKTNFVFTSYKNKLDFLNTPTASLRGDFDEYGDKPLVTLSIPGQSVGSFYGYVTNGLFRSMDDLNKDGINWGLDVKPDGQWLGDVRFKDLNNDKKIDDKDVTFIGSPIPKFTFGITNTVTFKGFDFSVFFNGSYGAKIFNYMKRQTEALNTQYNNQLSTALERYTANNPNSNIPRYNQWHNNNLRISDRYVEDGSYLRLQNITLGYKIPQPVSNKAKISLARVYIAAQNLKTFTKYSGYNPELGAINSRVTLQNIDNGSYPLPRTYTIGANIEF